MFSCADPECFVRGGPTWTFFCVVFLMRGGRHRVPLLSGLSSARQRNAIKWRFAGVAVMAQQ